MSPGRLISCFVLSYIILHHYIIPCYVISYDIILHYTHIDDKHRCFQPGKSCSPEPRKHISFTERTFIPTSRLIMPLLRICCLHRLVATLRSASPNIGNNLILNNLQFKVCYISALHPAAVRCDMVLHRAFHGRLVRQNRYRR